MTEILQNPTFLKYLLGLLGSVAVELAAMMRAVAANDGALPSPYNSRVYILIRIAFAIIGAGPLASLFADSIAMAFYVGVSAPLIFDRLAAGVQPYDQPISGSNGKD
jgi:hypothetical protein